MVYALMADRCSNGPHTTWADPLGPGGQPDREDWNMDNFGGNPKHRAAMVQTAENVAAEVGITKEECDIVVLRRFEQFMEAAPTTGRSRSATCSPRGHGDQEEDRNSWKRTKV